MTTANWSGIFGPKPYQMTFQPSLRYSSASGVTDATTART